MMRPFIILNKVTERDVAGDSVVVNEISAQALSVLLIRLRPLKETGTLANHARYRQICTALNNVTLSLNGHSIISMRGEDIAAMNWLRWGFIPPGPNPDNTNNDRDEICLPIILGRQPFDPQSCLPPVQRGQLALSLDFDDVDTGYDDLRFSVEAIELPDAKPREYERRVTISQTPAATGNNSLEFVPANLCRGILLFGTTPTTGASPAESFNTFRLRGDDDEIGYAGTDWETMHMLHTLLGRGQPDAASMQMTVDAAGAGIEETTSAYRGGFDWRQYAYLPFDWTGDDEYSVDFGRYKRVYAEINVGTADATRAVQCSVIKV